MKQSGKIPQANGKQEAVKRDRKSGSGFNGSPKKGGKGGKFTWSGDGYSQAELGFFDKQAIDYGVPNTRLNTNKA